MGLFWLNIFYNHAEKSPDAYHDFSNLEVQLIIRKPLRYFTFVYFSSLSELLMLIHNMRMISLITHRTFIVEPECS